MKLYRLLLAGFLLLASIAEVKAQVSSENLVNIHNLNTTEISGLVSPAKGSLVYNTDSNKLFVFDGTLWVATASVDTTSLSARINQRVKYTDTAAMLIGYVRKGDTASMLSNYINGATNGITKSGQNVKLGGALSEATTITTSGTNTLTLAGLQSGASTDSLMTVTATGVVKRINPSVLTSTGVKYSDTASMLSPYLRSALGVKYTDTASMLGNYVNGATNGITKSGQNVKLGGTLTEATTITTSGTNTLTFAGLQSGASTDSLMTVTAAGVVKRINPSVLTSTGVKYSDTASMLTPYLRKGDTASMLSPYLRSALGVKYTDTTSMLTNYVNTSSNGITKTGKNVKLGGALSEATTITTSATNTLTLAGVQSGASTDSIVTMTAAGLVRRISPSVLTGAGVKYSDTASMLTPYLRKGDTVSMLSPYLRSALGVKYTDTASMLGNYVNGGTNGITKSGQNVKLGGTLTEATTITTSGANTLTLAGLQSGASTDSLMTVTAAGVVKRINPSVLTSTGVKYSDTASMLTPYLRKGDTASMLSPYLRSALGVKYADTASMLGNYVNGGTNGITKSGQNVKLGGTLTEATTITTSGANTLTLAGLQSGSSTDSLMTVTAAGVVKRINPSVLTSTGVKYSDTASMLTPYLRKGDTASMLSPYLRSALGVKYADTASMLGNYVNGATNGITKSGQNVKLGGTLTEATTITTSGTNTLTLAGLQSGASTDSLMTVTATGVVKRINPSVLTSTGVKYSDTASMLTPYLRKGDTASMLSPYLRSALGVKYTDTASMLGNYVNGATNGITKSGQNVKLGGALTEATTITTSGTNTLTLAGLQSGASTDSLMTVTATGVVKRINPSVLTSAGVKYSDTSAMLAPYLRDGDTASMLNNYVNTSSNGITKTGKNVKLGGTLTEATTITTSGTNTLTLAGVQSGASTDSIVTMTSAGLVRRISPSVLTGAGVKYSDTASMLTPYLRKGDTTSMLSPYLRSALGVKYTDTASMLGNYVNGATNGITKSGQNVKLGGTLTEATTITTSGTNTLTLAGLQSGSSTDSLMTVTAAGVVKRINPSVLTSTGVKYSDTASMLTPYLRKGDTASMLSPYLRSALGVKYTDTASMLGNYVNGATNGITKSGQNVKLGGALTEATTITTSGTNTLTLAGLQSGASTDSLMTVTAAGVVKRINPSVLTSTGVKYSDTASMLSPYLRSALGVKYTDTASMLGNYVNGATNGITKSGQNVKLGGALTEATTITTSGTNTLTLAGLQSGASTDSLMTVTATGVVKRINPSVLTSTGVKYSDTASMLTPYLRKGDTASMLSPYLRSALGVKYTDTASMLTNYVNMSSNGITKTGKNVKLGGTLSEATTLVTSATNTFSLTGLQSGASTDSIMTITAAGVVKRINPSVLSSTGVKYTDTASMLTPYLRKGDTASMLSPYLRSALGVKYTDTAAMLGNYVNGAINGITKSGQNVKLGGALSEATTIGASATNTLAITGLQNGSFSDSLLTITTGGVLRKTSVATYTGTVMQYSDTAAMLVPYLRDGDTTAMLNNYINQAGNGLTKSGKAVQLGGSLSAATTLTATASNTLAVAGLQSGSTNDSIVVADASTGVLKRIASNRLSSGGSSWSTTGNSGTSASTNFIGTTDGVDLVFKVNNIESGRISLYNLSTSYGYSSLAAYKSTAFGSSATTSSSTEATALGYNAQAAAYRGTAVGSDAKATNNNAVALGQSATAAYQATALGSGASATGNNSTAIGYGASTAQANAIVLGGSSAQVGIGTSTPGYALDVTATSNPLRLGGVQSGASTDSLLTINTTTGVVRRVNPSLLSTSASNGLTMTGTNITLGGNLTAATTITNNANTLTFATGGSALNITGLAAGATTDSVLTINASGRVNRINAAAFTTTASNGLTMSGADARLGGSLTAATTITTSASNTLSLAGLQTSSLNDSVMMISSGNVVRRINAASVALEPFNVVGTTTKASSNTQNIYTSGNMSVGKSTNSATLEVAGKVKADSTVTAPNFVATFQDFGSTGGTVTWNMQSGSTAAIRLTSNATLSMSNVTQGMYGLIKVQQDGTGGRTITLPSGSKVINGGGGTVTLTSTANAVDVLTFFYDGTNYWWTIGNNYN